MVVATPGRLLDLFDEGALELKGVGYLVLDEARYAAEMQPRYGRDRRDAAQRS